MNPHRQPDSGRSHASSVRSFFGQMLHYLARPHQGVRMQPVVGPSVWTPTSLKDEPWCTRLTADQQAACLRMGVATTSEKDPTLGALEQLVRDLRHTLGEGRGFALVRGVPVDQMDPAQTETFFWRLGAALGQPGAQNTMGDLLGHVRDERDPEPGRLYRTASDIAFHCDAADVVGLMCLAKAQSGGQSMLASSAAIYNAILAKRPDLIPRLYEPFWLDAHGQRGIQRLKIHCARHAEDRLRIFYHSDYFRSGAPGGVPGLDPAGRELLDLFDNLANSPAHCLDMELEVGDIQFVSNHAVIHARRGYEDDPDPERRRHLLRLWLSLPTPRNLAARTRKASAAARTLAAFTAARWRGLDT